MKKTSTFLALFIAGSLVAESVSLAWDYNPPAENVDVYKIYHSTTGGAPWSVIGSTTNNSIQFDRLETGQNSFYVTAINQAGESLPSKILTKQTEAEKRRRGTKSKKSKRVSVSF